MLVTSDVQPLAQVSGEPKEMLSMALMPDGRHKVRINFSSLSLMQECWRKVEYSLLRGLRSNLESPATIFGSAIHKGLEVFYLAKPEERKLPRKYAETMEMIGCGAWELEWSESALFRAAYAFVARGEQLKHMPAENKRSITTGVWILTHYFDKYLDDPFVVLVDKDGPFVERKFSMVIHESDRLVIEMFGQIDVALQNIHTGMKLPGDHKTTSMLGQQFYQRLKPNAQYTCYSWAANDVFGMDTDAFLVNALQVKEMPKTARGSPPQFARQVTSRSREDYEELRIAIVRSVYNYIANLQTEQWPMTSPGPCSNYGGCQFIDVCAAPQSLRENIISAKYSERT